MKVNIITIPEEGLSVQFSLAGSLLPDLISGAGSEAGPEDLHDAFTLEKVDIAGSIKRYRQSLSFTGHLKTVLETMCARCLEVARVPVEADFRYTLLPAAAPGQDEIELQSDDLEVAYYDGEIIDLVPLVTEQVLLQIPMKVLCRESCRGLCPQCGINLNNGGCDCDKNVVDPRWAVLKNICK